MALKERLCQIYLDTNIVLVTFVMTRCKTGSNVKTEGLLFLIVPQMVLSTMARAAELWGSGVSHGSQQELEAIDYHTATSLGAENENECCCSTYLLLFKRSSPGSSGGAFRLD